MFSDKQCDRILELLIQHEHLWEARGSHEYGELHTVGAVSAFGDKLKYQTALQVANPILESHFRNEYEQLRTLAENLTGCQVLYDSRLALPGFQVFSNIKSGGDRELNGGIIHRDYLWGGREIADITGIKSVDEEYSATVMISKEKYSLDIWSDYPNGKWSLEYERGVPALHNHQLMHQVPYEGEVGSSRVSMQVRGFRIKDVVTLYL